jgi:hypothetical protein
MESFVLHRLVWPDSITKDLWVALVLSFALSGLRELGNSHVVLAKYWPRSK